MSRKFKVKVNDELYEVEVEEVSTDGQSNTASQIKTNSTPKTTSSSSTVSKPKPKAKKKPSPNVSTGGGTVESPMTGTILDVKVSQGDKVSSGDLLLILEAMKMENEVYAPLTGIVKEVNVSKDQKVEAGKILVVIE
ncbi:MAG: biotin/lipoyl-binding protein [Halanaerobiales bacterium]|nr:biotin/lipoyl-binding protein [Halanaerobiales bacterium]